MQSDASKAFQLVDARRVFRRLDARVIFLYRDPMAQYLSIQRGRNSERTLGRSDAWHCFEANASKCPKQQKGEVR